MRAIDTAIKAMVEGGATVDELRSTYIEKSEPLTVKTLDREVAVAAFARGDPAVIRFVCECGVAKGVNGALVAKAFSLGISDACLDVLDQFFAVKSKHVLMDALVDLSRFDAGAFAKFQRAHTRYDARPTMNCLWWICSMAQDEFAQWRSVLSLMNKSRELNGFEINAVVSAMKGDEHAWKARLNFLEEEVGFRISEKTLNSMFARHGLPQHALDALSQYRIQRARSDGAKRGAITKKANAMVLKRLATQAPQGPPGPQDPQVSAE